MSIYDELQQVTKGIMKEFKQGSISIVQFEYPIDSTPDNPGEPQEFIIPLDASAKGPSFKYLRDSFITTSDVEVTSSVVNGLTPSENDLIEIDGERYKILKFDPLPRAGTPCAWKFIVRKGG